MPLIEAELGEAFAGAVKRKANNTKKLRLAVRKTAKRVVTNSSEVMVKITGFGKGGGHVKAHLDYISRKGDVELENDRGEVFSGKEEVNEFFKGWEGDFSRGRRHANQRDTVHMVLSMPENTEPEAVRNAVRGFAKDTFGQNHEYVFALHTDEPHPHCHLTVKMQGVNGKRLNPRKADLQTWRESFAENLRHFGVDAAATPRPSRGVIKKAEASVIRHIERGDKTHKPRVSKVRAAKIKEAANELAVEAKGVPATPKPWESAIKARQEKVRQAWLATATALEQEDTRKTFNQKEAKNERPQYDRISADDARPAQRAAALYQSNLAKSRRKASPRTFARVRNLSGLGVVHDGRKAEMLLQPDAPDRMGRQGRADSEMRRARAGDIGATGGAKRLTDYEGTTAENKALADRIRGFVAAMPGIDTEHQRIKRELAEKFTKSIQNAPTPALPTSAPDHGQKNGAGQAAPKGGGKDVQR